MNRSLCRTYVFPHRQPVLEPQLGVARSCGVEQVNHVPVCRPDRAQAHVAGTAKRKLKSTGFILAGQSNLSHREVVGHQVLFLAQRLVNELAQVFQRVDVVDRDVHRVVRVEKLVRSQSVPSTKAAGRPVEILFGGRQG